MLRGLSGCHRVMTPLGRHGGSTAARMSHTVSHTDRDEPEGLPDRHAREGAFDEQLSFETPVVEAPQPVRTIIKRDGRAVPFEKSKIGDAIFKAAQSIGGEDRDRAESLAAGVAIYLSKTLNGETPTVDQVHDAVEKVLIEMGHAKTALAYARYRDKRARVRRLRQGDMGALLGELEEARRRGSADEPADRRLRSVRTSDERLTGWDREKIVEALVRETGLDRANASIIAVEAEEQIAAADVQTLTASLIRELVDAKLIEHGLEEHRRKHARLGVPLYDAEQIICRPNQDETLSDHDPEATDLVLAERVKREFALTEVLSRNVAEAHLEGDIHVHHLGFVDRLHSATLSLDYLKRHGIRRPDERDIRRPPKALDGLFAQMIKFTALLQHHFVERISWDAFNVLVAPFIQQIDAQPLEQLARSVAFWCAPRTTLLGRRPPITELMIHWDVPVDLRDMEAIGAEGNSTGRPYGEFLHQAQELAWTLIDVYKEADSLSGVAAKPTITIGVTPALFKSPGHEAFLMHAADGAIRSGCIDFAFDRDAQPSKEARSPWQPRAVIVHQVTLNMPRAAFRARDDEALFQELDRLVESAVRAHIQRKLFLEKLLALNDTGPLGLLALPCEGWSFVDLDRGDYLVSILGLNECVQTVLGEQLHESEAAMVLGLRIARHLRGLCACWSTRAGLRIVLGQTVEEAAGRRLANLDLEQFPEPSSAVVKADPETQDIYYTPGTQLAAESRVTPVERVRLEGRFHEWTAAGAQSVVRMPDVDTSKESIANFVTKVFHQTRNRRVTFSN